MIGWAFSTGLFASLVSPRPAGKRVRRDQMPPPRLLALVIFGLSRADTAVLRERGATLYIGRGRRIRHRIHAAVTGRDTY